MVRNLMVMRHKLESQGWHAILNGCQNAYFVVTNNTHHLNTCISKYKSMITEWHWVVHSDSLKRDNQMDDRLSSDFRKWECSLYTHQEVHFQCFAGNKNVKNHIFRIHQEWLCPRMTFRHIRVFYRRHKKALHRIKKTPAIGPFIIVHNAYIHI